MADEKNLVLEFLPKLFWIVVPALLGLLILIYKKSKGRISRLNIETLRRKADDHSLTVRDFPELDSLARSFPFTASAFHQVTSEIIREALLTDASLKAELAALLKTQDEIRICIMTEREDLIPVSSKSLKAYQYEEPVFIGLFFNREKHTLDIRSTAYKNLDEKNHLSRIASCLERRLK